MASIGSEVRILITALGTSVRGPDEGFYTAGPRNVFSLEIRFKISVWHFFDFCCATVDLLVTRIGPKWFINNTNGGIRPIRDNIIGE